MGYSQAKNSIPIALNLEKNWNKLKNKFQEVKEEYLQLMALKMMICKLRNMHFKHVENPSSFSTTNIKW